MHINDHTLLLITRRLEGTASAEEELQLQQWLEAAAENQEEYNELARIWHTGASLFPSTPDFNNHAAWTKLHETITSRRKEHQSKQAKIISIRRRLTAAAAILILAIGGWYGWNAYRSRMQVITAVDTNQTIQLPDGSSILLRKGSTVRYAADFNNKQEHRVQLTGEAFFQVQHDPQRPFRISTSRSTISVLGTSFLVNADDHSDKVIVLTGKLSVTETTSHKEAMLIAGQEAIVADRSLQQTQITDSNFMAWKTGVLDFKNTPLPKVLNDLADYYATPMAIAHDNQEADLQRIHLNVQFHNQLLEQVIDELQLLTGLSVKTENGIHIFYKK